MPLPASGKGMTASVIVATAGGSDATGADEVDVLTNADAEALMLLLVTMSAVPEPEVGELDEADEATGGAEVEAEERLARVRSPADGMACWIVDWARQSGEKSSKRASSGMVRAGMLSCAGQLSESR